jgi:hypothetical protein
MGLHSAATFSRVDFSKRHPGESRHRALRHNHRDPVLSSTAIWHLCQPWIVIAILLLDTDSDMKQVIIRRVVMIKLQQMLLDRDAGQK